MRPKHIIYTLILVLAFTSAYALSGKIKGGSTTMRGRCCVDIRADGG